MSAQPMRPVGPMESGRPTALGRPIPPGASRSRPSVPGRAAQPVRASQPARGAQPRTVGANALAPERAPRAVPRPGSRPAPAPARAPHLRPVTTPEPSRSLTPFAVLCVSFILAAMAAVLMLNTELTRGAHDAALMRREIAQYQQQRVTLLTQLEAAAAPGGLAAAAQGLGMVPADRIGFVSLSDATVMESSAG